MNRSDLKFKTACQTWHTKFRKCSDHEEMRAMRSHVEHQAIEWLRHRKKVRARIALLEKQLAEAKREEVSTVLRIQMVGQLGAFMIRGERELEFRIRRQTADTVIEGKQKEEQQQSGIPDNFGGENVS